MTLLHTRLTLYALPFMRYQVVYFNLLYAVLSSPLRYHINAVSLSIVFMWYYVVLYVVLSSFTWYYVVL